MGWAAHPSGLAARTYGFVATGSKLTSPNVPPVFADWFAVLPDYFRTLSVPAEDLKMIDMVPER